METRLLIFNGVNIYGVRRPYTIQVLTPPVEEPVTVAELADHLSLNSNNENGLLEMYITAAREMFEMQTDGRVVLPTTFVQHCDDWNRVIRLQRADVLDVVSVDYYDGSEVLTELIDWESDLSGIPGLVYLPASYPGLSQTKPRPIQVTFTAGWADVNSVPKSVKLAVLNKAAEIYYDREGGMEDGSSAFSAGFNRVCSFWKTGLGVI